MLKRIIKAVIAHSGFVIAASILVLIIGFWSYLNIPVDAFPDVTNIQAEIVCRKEGLSAVELERTVTIPLENALRGLPGVKDLRSVSKYGISMITVVFTENTDIIKARQFVFERLMMAREDLPEGVETELSPFATVMGEIYQYSLITQIPADADEKRIRLTELRTIQDWIIAPLLKAVPGVSEVNSYGGYIKEYQVIIDLEKIVKYKVSPGELLTSLDENNRIIKGGIIEKNGSKAIIRGIGRIQTIAEIEEIPVAFNEDFPVKVRDIAKVRIGESVRQGAAIENGEESVGGIVMMLRGANGKQVVARVKQKVKEINEGTILPRGIKLKPYYDRTVMVNASISTVTKALFEGILFSLIILLFFLRSIRGTLVILLSLPLTLLTAFALMKIFKVDANLMSLGGMAISVGMIIDTTVIQVENIQRRLAERDVHAHLHLTDLVIDAIMEVRKPTLLGELIIATTFLPIITFQGIEGKMFIPLALTVIIVLLASLLLSVFIIPAIAFVMLSKTKHQENPVFDRMQKIYLVFLAVCLRRRRWVISSALAVCVFAVFLVPRLGTEFIPVMDEGAFDMDVTLHPGISLDQAIAANLLVSKALKKFPEIETAIGRIGQTGVALDVRGVDRTGYVGILRPRKEWTNEKTRDELFNRFREALADIPGVSFGFSQPIQCRIDEIIAGTKAQLVIKIFGDELEALALIGGKIRKTLQTVTGITDLAVERNTGQRSLVIIPDRRAMSRYGLSLAVVEETIEVATSGIAATEINEGEKVFELRVRYPDYVRNSREALEKILVNTPRGNRVPLGDVAKLVWEEGPLQISRENGKRRLAVEMNVTGRDIGGFVSEAKKLIKKNVDLPTGYYLHWGGQFENQERAMKSLGVIGPMAVLIIIALLFITFRSVLLAGLILINLPFSMAGGIIGLLITNQYLSVPASIGFIVLFGVAVLNGMVLISYLQQLGEQEAIDHNIIIRGCKDRLRSIIMTAAIAISSLVPLLFAQGTGSEIQKPLATVVIGGFVTASIGTLFVLPVLYSLFNDHRAADRTPRSKMHTGENRALETDIP